MPQPDVLLRYKVGGSRISDRKFVEGTPELVAEIATSSASIDLNSKFRAYEAAGIPEYVVWRTRDNKVDWFVLTDGKYAALARSLEGVWESRVFPGLRLSESALMEGSLRDLLAPLS